MPLIAVNIVFLIYNILTIYDNNLLLSSALLIYKLLNQLGLTIPYYYSASVVNEYNDRTVS